MTRTVINLIQAALVMAAIVLSPYAMFAQKGCGSGRPEPAAGGAEVVVASPEEPDASRDDPEPIDEGAGEPSACLVPDVPIQRSAGCDGGGYPGCRWKLPEAGEAGKLYGTWRYTTESHRWGRPALVALVLATAREYALLHPGETITVGDLDAPGPRHATHASGVDADIYLPGRMAAENTGKGHVEDGYAGRPSSFVDECRGRVLDLARILATCTGGRIRIFYNDPPLESAFLDWFAEQGYETPFEAAMTPHNDLHRFHFHVTIPEDLPVLPAE